MSLVANWNRGVRINKKAIERINLIELKPQPTGQFVYLRILCVCIRKSFNQTLSADSINGNYIIVITRSTTLQSSHILALTNICLHFCIIADCALWEIFVCSYPKEIHTQTKWSTLWYVLYIGEYYYFNNSCN